MKALRGFIPDYTAQTVTNEQHVVIAAEVMTAAPDFGHLEPMPVLVVELVGERLPAILVGNSFGGRIALETARGMEIACPGYGHAAPRPSSRTPRVTAPAWPEPRPLSALTMPVLVSASATPTTCLTHRPRGARRAK